MKKILYIIIFLIIPLYIFAGAEPSRRDNTDTNVVGHVLEKSTGEHMAFVTIQVKGTTTGCVTDASGHYFLTNLPTGKVTLIYSMVGYKTLEITVNLKAGETLELNGELEEESILMDQIVVTANKYETKKREASTIVNVISPLVFEKTSANAMADVLDFQTGVRVENSCSNCGASELKINGLGGQYTQIMMDSRPIFSSLAAVYGLEQIPTGMVDRVEVIRGGGSALYGANAIAGVVNIITKEPSRNSLNIANNTQVVGGKAWDVNTNLNGSFVSSDSKIGVFLFGVIRQRDTYDSDKDGFSELPRLKSATVGFRSYFKTSDYSKLTAEYHYSTEDRRGGSEIDKPEHESDITESLKHRINAGKVNWDYYSPNERHFLSIYTSLQHIGRRSYFGVGKDPNAYGRSSDFTVTAGAQYRFHYPCGLMPGDLSVGTEYTYNNLEDEIMGYNRDFLQKVHLYGGYVQNEWKNKVVSCLIGVRGEKHNMLNHPIFSPRANVRYTPIEEIVLRASYASGYRAPQAYDEDLHVDAVGGEVSLIYMKPDLKPEFSHSASLSMDWAQKLGNSWEANVTLEGFFTQLNNVFTLVEDGFDANGNKRMLRTNAKGARIAGLNLEGKIAYKSMFNFQLGYTFQQSRYIEDFKWSDDVAPQKKMFRAPDHYGYFMASVEPFKNFSINLNGKLSGPMLVQHMAGVIEKDIEIMTPTFFDMGAKIAYEIPLYKLYTMEINVGVKNIFNAYQKDFDKGINRDAAYVYGPTLPRTYFFGLNFKL